MIWENFGAVTGDALCSMRRCQKKRFEEILKHLRFDITLWYILFSYCISMCHIYYDCFCMIIFLCINCVYIYIFTYIVGVIKLFHIRIINSFHFFIYFPFTMHITLVITRIISNYVNKRLMMLVGCLRLVDLEAVLVLNKYHIE